MVRSGVGTGANGGMSVQVDALLAFTEKMQQQYDILLHYGAGLADLGKALTDPALLGDFPEARMLVQRHRDATADLTEILQEVRDGIDYAARVTRWVANQYVTGDQNAASGIADVSSGHQVGRV